MFARDIHFSMIVGLAPMTGLDALSLALGSKNDKHFDAVRDGITDLKQEVTGLQEALRTNELIICDIDSGSTR
jgi:hypothetical protein